MDSYESLKAQKDKILQSEREALERPLLAKIDALRLVVNGLAKANVLDVEHMRALKSLAQDAIEETKE